MFREKPAAKQHMDTQPAEQARVVYLYIKTADFSESPFDTEVDRVTEVAMHEYIDGKKTKNEFHSYIHPEDEDFLQRCLTTYKERLEPDHAKELSDGLVKAPRFSEIQDKLFEFMRRDNASVVIHYKPRILAFLRAASDERGVEILKTHRDYMIDIKSQAQTLSKAGLYNARKYEKEIDKDRDAKLTTGKAGFTFTEICTELGPKIMRRDTWSALYDVRRLALAHQECKARLAKLQTTPAPVMKMRKH